uniref:Uncharacterized protein n=1 Tax=Arundo donax TaxID=35708 RepID=A0A0A9FFU9_ARUDO
MYRDSICTKTGSNLVKLQPQIMQGFILFIAEINSVCFHLTLKNSD